MWPWGHLAVAYLIYASYRRLGAGRLPSTAVVVLVAFGSQFPDLLDKPLAWYLGVLSSGRSLSHSLFVLIPLSLGMTVLARRFDREELALAFTIGALSHVVVDAMPAVRGNADPRFLGWPLTSVGQSEGTSMSVGKLFRMRVREPSFYVEFIIVAVAVIVWYNEGAPGAAAVSDRTEFDP